MTDNTDITVIPVLPEWRFQFVLKQALQAIAHTEADGYTSEGHERAVDEAVAALAAHAAMRTVNERNAAPVPEFEADQAWQELCEKDDRTSPAEYPDHVLITRAELAALMRSAAPATLAPDVHGPYVPCFIGTGTWAGIIEALPADLVGKSVWVTTTPPVAGAAPASGSTSVERAASILYHAWNRIEDLPDNVQKLVSQGLFFSALREIFEPGFKYNTKATPPSAVAVSTQAGSRRDLWATAARSMLAAHEGIGNGDSADRDDARHVIYAGCFAAEAYVVTPIDRDAATYALTRAFLVALIDTADPRLDYLRAGSPTPPAAEEG